MATRAYILIETEVGQAKPVLAAFAPWQTSWRPTSSRGTTTSFVLAEADDMVALVDLVTAQVQNINGVERTITCVAA